METMEKESSRSRGKMIEATDNLTLASMSREQELFRSNYCKCNLTIKKVDSAVMMYAGLFT